nr:type IV pilin [uncultured Methanoregula sp.]
MSDRTILYTGKKRYLHTGEHAVSEVIGATLLISIVVIAIAVIGVAINSQPPPQKIPAVSAVISNTGNTIHIYHDGGDYLQKDQFSIYFDGVKEPISSFSNNGNSAWTSWSIGQSLDFPLASGQSPGLVQIVYTGTGSSEVIAYADFNAGTIHYNPTSAPTGTTTTGTITTATSTTTTTTTITTTSTTTTTTTTTTPAVPVQANFTASPTSGYTPLAVQFTDLSTGPVNNWSWSYGDGNSSYAQNPQYTYPIAGNYTVSLTVKNTTTGATNTLTKTNYIWAQTFAEYVANESVFVYGSKLYFMGSRVVGPGSTVILTGTSITTGDFNGGAIVDVSNIYVDGDVSLNSGSASWGSSSSPGIIFVNGDMSVLSGGRDFYGDIYVNGNFNIKDSRIHGNVYVDGDVTLDWTPTLDTNSYIYYTGTLSHPASYPTEILDKCIYQDTVPTKSMPDLTMPSAKTSAWYTSHGYTSSSGGTLTDNMKIIADSGYTSSSWSSSATNIVIIARNGDITLNQGWGYITGVLYAPNGKVTYDGGDFQGLVIARDGFYVTHGGTTVTFKNLGDYFSSSADYPF